MTIRPTVSVCIGPDVKMNGHTQQLGEATYLHVSLGEYGEVHLFGTVADMVAFGAQLTAAVAAAGWVDDAGPPPPELQDILDALVPADSGLLAPGEGT